MEERALYQAILAAPHDDTPRLVYADWLQEHADGLSGPAARAARVRAEFIRLQCAMARSGPGGWRRGAPFDPALARRERRLLFTHGRKWRQAFPAWLASHPFDRGFLRPLRSLHPDQFLGERRVFPPLPPDSPARRFLIDEDLFSLCPLWDIHLYAPDYPGDPTSDVGQYGEWLARVGGSASLARVGCLHVSFFRTPTVEFLRTGNFVNVETLILDSGPFPEVLEAVAGNELFQSLRYVWFGQNWWAWAVTTSAHMQYREFSRVLYDANSRNLPYGEMRTVLRAILRGITVRSVPEPQPLWADPLRPQPAGGSPGTVGQQERAFNSGVQFFLWCIGLAYGLAFITFCLSALGSKGRQDPTTPIDLPPLKAFPRLKAPDSKILTSEEFNLMLSGSRRRGMESPVTLPVAPPPRMVPETKPKRNE